MFYQLSTVHTKNMGIFSTCMSHLPYKTTRFFYPLGSVHRKNRPDSPGEMKCPGICVNWSCAMLFGTLEILEFLSKVYIMVYHGSACPGSGLRSLSPGNNGSLDGSLPPIEVAVSVPMEFKKPKIVGMHKILYQSLPFLKLTTKQPENTPLEKQKHLPTTNFWVLC